MPIEKKIKRKKDEINRGRNFIINKDVLKNTVFNIFKKTDITMQTVIQVLEYIKI